MAKRLSVLLSGEGYLSDDMDSRMRASAPAPCRLCRHHTTKRSLIDDSVLRGCDRPEQAPNAEILAALLLSAARRDEACLFADLF